MQQAYFSVLLSDSAASPSSIWSRAAEGAFWSRQHTHAQSHPGVKDDLNCISPVQMLGCVGQHPASAGRQCPTGSRVIFGKTGSGLSASTAPFPAKSACKHGVTLSPASKPQLHATSTQTHGKWFLQQQQWGFNIRYSPERTCWWVRHSCTAGMIRGTSLHVRKPITPFPPSPACWRQGRQGELCSSKPEALCQGTRSTAPGISVVHGQGLSSSLPERAAEADTYTGQNLFPNTSFISFSHEIFLSEYSLHLENRREVFFHKARQIIDYIEISFPQLRYLPLACARKILMILKVVFLKPRPCVAPCRAVFVKL